MSIVGVAVAIVMIVSIASIVGIFLSYGWGRSDGYDAGWEDALCAARIKEANNDR